MTDRQKLTDDRLLSLLEMRHADAVLALKQARDSVAAARSNLAAARRRLEEAGSALKAAEEAALLASALVEEERFIRRQG
jgi:hypothetical protein